MFHAAHERYGQPISKALLVLFPSPSRPSSSRSQADKMQPRHHPCGHLPAELISTILAGRGSRLLPLPNALSFAASCIDHGRILQ
ncbi:unnamed protein product [Periconia digitata]|uniref:Uncharacterized protein n=1 Tax=Periconia digitata TaxID=1303443 RepID=A0A9W4UB86_9PLEO|nr:unnamed protein product [Periconia digitata]